MCTFAYGAIGVSSETYSTEGWPVTYCGETRGTKHRDKEQNIATRRKEWDSATLPGVNRRLALLAEEVRLAFRELRSENLGMPVDKLEDAVELKADSEVELRSGRAGEGWTRARISARRTAYLYPRIYTNHHWTADAGHQSVQKFHMAPSYRLPLRNAGRDREDKLSTGRAGRSEGDVAVWQWLFAMDPRRPTRRRIMRGCLSRMPTNVPGSGAIGGPEQAERPVISRNCGTWKELQGETGIRHVDGAPLSTLWQGARPQQLPVSVHSSITERRPASAIVEAACPWAPYPWAADLAARGVDEHDMSRELTTDKARTRLRNESGADITVNRDDNTIVIVGSETAIETAKEAILKMTTNNGGRGRGRRED
ncbi:hypothetical protein NUW54_g10215 [Trametes sanguinea]|uniref:Uncharacterized protein n=1 Tax=Trametes sanguinea TaxID=158606 RepID=A0ACC1P288_9APHY|nr:hypothetical protein NUW54_g10215 [Trametes sanguinea]